jgi:hypothetical protein
VLSLIFRTAKRIIFRAQNTATRTYDLPDANVKLTGSAATLTPGKLLKADANSLAADSIVSESAGALTIAGNVGFGVEPLSAGAAAKWLTLDGTAYSGGVICSVDGVAKGLYYYESGYALAQGSTGAGFKIIVNQSTTIALFKTDGTIEFAGSAPGTASAGQTNIGGGVIDTAGNVIAGGVYKVGANQVIAAQGAAVADATGAGDVVAQLNALLARCRAHGLIAT